MFLVRRAAMPCDVTHNRGPSETNNEGVNICGGHVR
jgi:hypothetical protein